MRISTSRNVRWVMQLARMLETRIEKYLSWKSEGKDHLEEPGKQKGDSRMNVREVRCKFILLRIRTSGGLM
jgi:hypothetical protein